MENRIFRRILVMALILMFVNQVSLAQLFTAVNSEGKSLWYKIIYDNNQPTDMVELTSAQEGSSYEGSLVIPSTVVCPDDAKTYTVVGVGNKAFNNCNKVEFVNLPQTITYIGDHAFYYCSSLISIDGGSGLKMIDQSAFTGCSNLESFNVPEGLDSIGNRAFSGCSKLNPRIPSTLTKLGGYAFYYTAITSENAVLPAAITAIPENLFYGCTSLTKLTIPNTVVSIGSSAFQASGIQSIRIPGTVKQIGSYLFEGSELISAVLEEGITNIPYGAFYSTPLQTIEVPSTLTSIGKDAFYSCTSLSSFVFPEGLKSIGERAFESSGLKEAILPEGLEFLGESAFSKCSMLLRVTLPKKIDTILNNTFYECSLLTSILIPENVKTIGSLAFYKCEGLVEVIMPDSFTSIGGSCFMFCKNLKSIVIPEGITQLNDQTFYGCSSLSTIKLPETLTSIYGSALNYCNNLSKIYMKSTTPPKGNGNHSATAVVYVPKGCVEAYQATSPWSNAKYTIEEWDGVDKFNIAEEDWKILKTIYQKANSNVLNQKWSLGDSPEGVTNLLGVELDDNGHVIYLSLPGNGVKKDILADVLSLPNIADINISGNNIGCNLNDLLNEKKASVTSLNISDNLYEGNIGAFAQMLPILTVIKAINNHISEIDPLFNSTVTTHEIRGQTLDIVLNFKELAQKAGTYLYDVMPPLLCYSDERNSLTSKTTYFCVNGSFEMKQPELLLTFAKNAKAGISPQGGINNAIFKGESGVELEAKAITSSSTYTYKTNEWHKFRMIFEFDPGDIDYSGTTDVSDLQSAIKVSVNYGIDYYFNTPFNLTAGDLMQDGSINVIDVVRLINLLLDDNTVTNAPRRIAADNFCEEEIPDPEVILYMQDGQLVMQAEKPVGAIDLTVNASGLHDAWWMPGNSSYGATMRDRNGKTRAIVCALNGDSLQVGRTILADFSQVNSNGVGICHATVTDPEGRQLMVAIDNNDADGIKAHDSSALATDAVGNVYDLSGRMVASPYSCNRKLQKGLYIDNGKKIVIK